MKNKKLFLIITAVVAIWFVFMIAVFESDVAYGLPFNQATIPQEPEPVLALVFDWSNSYPTFYRDDSFKDKADDWFVLKRPGFAIWLVWDQDKIPDFSNLNSSEPSGPVAHTPEPATMLLVGAGLTGLAYFVRRRKKQWIN